MAKGQMGKKTPLTTIKRKRAAKKAKKRK